MVLLSRVRPAFPTAKLALDGELAELGRDDLLLRPRPGGGGRRAPAAAHHPRTPRSTRCSASPRAGRRAWCSPPRGPAGRDPESLDGSLAGGDLGRAVFPYLAEQVYARQSPEAQAFLKRSCCLDSLTTALAEAVTGVPDAGRLLARLEADGAFTFAGPSGGAYRYHPLLRGFLQGRARGRGRAGRGHRAAGAERRGARRAAAAARRPSRSTSRPATRRRRVGVLREQGYRLLEECAQPLLSRWTAALGGKGRAYAGWATLLEGHQLFVSGDLRAARRRLEAALPLLAEDRMRPLPHAAGAGELLLGGRRRTTTRRLRAAGPGGERGPRPRRSACAPWRRCSPSPAAGRSSTRRRPRSPTAARCPPSSRPT